VELELGLLLGVAGGRFVDVFGGFLLFVVLRCFLRCLLLFSVVSLVFSTVFVELLESDCAERQGQKRGRKGAVKRCITIRDRQRRRPRQVSPRISSKEVEYRKVCMYAALSCPPVVRSYAQLL